RCPRLPAAAPRAPGKWCLGWVFPAADEDVSLSDWPSDSPQRGSLGSCRKPGGSQRALVGFPVRATLPASLINSPALAPLLLLAGASLVIPFWTAARYGGAAARITAALSPALNLGALFLFLFLATLLSKPIGAAGAAALAVAAYALMLVHLGALALPRLRGKSFAVVVLIPGTVLTTACLLGL